MSQSDSSASDSPALGSRENWWGDGDEPHDLEPAQQRGHYELPGVSRLAWLAKSILLKAGEPTLLCPRCYHELDLASGLSEPEDYVPESLVKMEDGQLVQMYGDHRRHRYCLNDECGHVSWGGILQDRTPEKFLRIVREVLDVADLPSSTRNAIYAEAQGRKARGVSDRSNLETVIVEIENPGLIGDIENPGAIR